jgi:glyoxylase-like metal-dependent hydrolase (beta-lactamase superfamily II)
MLYCPSKKLLISDDQVLPRISSNVSVFLGEPHGDPLKEWLDSCDAIQGRVPDDTLVLPSHDTPFYGLHKRLKVLIKGHEDGLKSLYELCAEPKRVVDVFPALFK